MKKFKLTIVILLIILGLFLFFRNEILDFYLNLNVKLPEIEKGVTGFISEEIKKQISTPPPLRTEEESPQASLTKDGVVQWTNLQREKYGVAQLQENEKLNEAAKAKLDDMFAKQYFDHISPTGEGVSDLAEKVGYKFIAIGENLALGNFQDDETLVQAWMDSPGHRANILSSIYQEIGVAVGKGVFEGRTTWLAVQHFGLPLSACSQPDENLKAEIEKNQIQIQDFSEALQTLKSEIQAISPKRGETYNQIVEQYNNLVFQYNSLLNTTKTLIQKYNSQVNLFNNCIVSFTQ